MPLSGWIAPVRMLWVTPLALSTLIALHASLFLPAFHFLPFALAPLTYPTLISLCVPLLQRQQPVAMVSAAHG